MAVAVARFSLTRESMPSSAPNPAPHSPWLERFSQRATIATGSSAAFGLAVLTILLWVISGPVFGYSDTWQLVINTSTTIVTFLMVFLIQRSQNKDSSALHMKLNELVAAIEGASNRLVSVEDMCEADLDTLHAHYQRMAQLATADANVEQSHSLDEAEQRHAAKRQRRSRKTAP